ncbi:restriction endonuclease subunit S [Dyella dinghuensis]|nr:restriction endonuclease subunit S [Dyella dinghuensis]
MLPKGWRATRISELAEVVRGASPRPAGDPRYFDGDYLPWITVAEVTANTQMCLTGTKAKLTEAGSKYTRIVEAGTLILTNSGATLGVPKITKIRAGANDGIAMLLNLRGASKEFLYYFLQSKTDYLREVVAPGNGQPNLNTELIAAIPVIVPTVYEQEKIVEMMMVWDFAIATIDRLLANSRKQKQALMRSLFSDSHRKKQGLPPLPREHASEMFAPNSVRRNDGLELLSVMQGEGIVPRSSLDRKVVMPDGSTDSYKLVEPGDFVISLRSFEGGLEYSKYTGLVSPAYTVLKPRKIVDDDFYRHYFKSRDFIGRLAVAVIGIRDGKQISYDDFAFLRLPAPDINVQRRIAKALNLAEDVIIKHAAELEKLRTEKAALMQQLLTGKRRVKLDSE